MLDRRQKFLQRVEQKRSEAKQKRVLSEADLHQIAQGEVDMRALVDHPHWRRFLQVIQGRIDNAQAWIDKLPEILCNPDDGDAEALMRLKLNAVGLAARRDAMREVLGMPQQIIETGEVARDELEQAEERVADESA